MPNEFVGFESVPTVMLYKALIQAGVIADGQSSVASVPSPESARKLRLHSFKIDKTYLCSLLFWPGHQLELAFALVLDC
jgi:hypothetical protein